jgi:hypothetical protein
MADKRIYARPAKPWDEMTPEEKREFAQDFVRNLQMIRAEKKAKGQ